VGFSAVSAVTRRTPTGFTADVDPGWTIGGKPNGGYLLAMLGRAAVAAGGHPDVLAASAHYLRAPDPGGADIEATVLRNGRSAGQVRARMSQDGQACVEALITTGRLDPADAPFWAAGAPAPDISAFADCEPLAWGLPDGRHVAIMQQVDVRLEPATAGFTRAEPSGRGELRGWLALPDGEPFDPISLLYAVDAFPPATFDIAMSGWVPTFELTAYVRAVPAPGPVRVLQRAQLIQGHRVDEACFVWDRDGRLVAQATQLAGIRL
jgi:hypothetical protein